MKNNILAFIILIILFGLSSCSKDESSSADKGGDVTLVKTIVYSDYPFMQEYTYDGAKLKKLKIDKSGHSGYGDSYYLTFYYTGDLITKIESYDVNNVLGDYTDLKYSNKQLVETRSYVGKFLHVKYEYMYNSDGSVGKNVTNYQSDGTVDHIFSSRFYFDSTGNIIKEVTGSNASTVYTYDEKNNPLKNIIGFKEALILEEFEYSPNNVVTTISYDGTVQSYKQIHSYEYNDKGFPVSCAISINGKPKSTRNYYY